MHILFNGEPLDIEDGASIAALLHGQGLAERRVAVEVNDRIVPRSLHASHPLCEGDKVEVVHALGGG